MCLGKNSDKGNNKEVTIGITTDNNLTFDSHLKNMQRTANQKLCIDNIHLSFIKLIEGHFKNS